MSMLALLHPRHAACRSTDHRELLIGVSPATVGEYAAECLGLEVQAITLARLRASSHDALQVWEVMTPRGFFWLAEDGLVAELFPTSLCKTFRQTTTASSASRAAAWFRELHEACGPGQAETLEAPERVAGTAI
jgi:hypothetical protein